MLIDYPATQKLVAQHNKLINGYYQFDIHELRIFVYLMLNIKKGDNEFRDVIILAKDLQLQNDKVHYEQIKKACNSLTKKTIEVEEVNAKGKKTFKAIPLMSFCMYNEGDGSLTAKFNDHAQPYLLNLKENFTSAQLKNFKYITSYYSYRMYWLLKQYGDFGHREINLDELKKLLGLESKYNSYYDLKKRVILPVQKELADMDMAFTFKEKKKGRKVSSIVFTYSSRKKKDITPQAEVPVHTDHPSQIPLKFATSPIPADNFDRFLYQHRFSENEVEAIKARVDKTTYKRIIYHFQTDEALRTHPKDIREMLLDEFDRVRDA